MTTKTTEDAPRYSVLPPVRGKMFRVFDRKKRRVAARAPTLKEADRIRKEKEKKEP